MCEFALNTMGSTGFAPAFMVYGCNPVLPLALLGELFMDLSGQLLIMFRLCKQLLSQFE